MPDTSAIAIGGAMPRPKAGQNDRWRSVDADANAIHAEAEIKRLAERQQPDIAKQQVDARRKQRPDQDLGNHAYPERLTSAGTDHGTDSMNAANSTNTKRSMATRPLIGHAP